MQLSWTLTRTAAQSLNRWDGLYEWNKKTRVVHLGARDLGYQRQPTLIYEQMVFAAEVATISRISARMDAIRAYALFLRLYGPLRAIILITLPGRLRSSHDATGRSSRAETNLNLVLKVRRFCFLFLHSLDPLQTFISALVGE